ncbi:hypothetical protein GP486_002239 [Trichoglossum hirsutum]|uniref:TauD/TfdA-like domain-containing protein n=1 Tax=Trichoglossum hirsutum TaxID=265104 RepID=A0A9P8LFF6_9PEZI|nr:hypothetical protein GP486_002239 [Trichoglossum hirsutum]
MAERSKQNGLDSNAYENEKVVDMNCNGAMARQPLKLSGILNQFKSFDSTPVIGTEFPDVSLADWITAPNSDALLRDLAITISRRGVVFFRKQSDLTDSMQKELAHRLGQLTGKPKSSTLHIHPLTNFDCGKDKTVHVISTSEKQNPAEDLFSNHNHRRGGNLGNWHSDISYEQVPSDYTVLRLTELPQTGGDTLWASGYEVYDRISPPYRKFLSSLTANFAQVRYPMTAKTKNFQIYSDERGSPENVGSDLKAVHPVIRTNPVTGWRSVYAVGNHFQSINDLTQEESNQLHDWFLRLIAHNHDLQVRNRWQNPNDVGMSHFYLFVQTFSCGYFSLVAWMLTNGRLAKMGYSAIWDNRSIYHAATFDFQGLGPRTGHRAVGIGERPFFSPGSLSRREALSLS